MTVVIIVKRRRRCGRYRRAGVQDGIGISEHQNEEGQRPLRENNDHPLLQEQDH